MVFLLQPATTKVTTGELFCYDGDGVAVPASYFCWNHTLFLLRLAIFLLLLRVSTFFYKLVVGVLRPATDATGAAAVSMGTCNSWRTLLHGRRRETQEAAAATPTCWDDDDWRRGRRQVRLAGRCFEAPGTSLVHGGAVEAFFFLKRR